MMSNNTTILLIDDDTWMQRVLTKIITRLDIKEVFSAINGFMGVNMAIEKSPDVIFLDLIMPEIDGLVTLKMLKSINLTKNIPVIIITSNSDFDSIGAVLNAGATDFIVKPFTFATIQEKLIKVLSASKTKSSNYNDVNSTIDKLEMENDEVDFLNSLDLAENIINIDFSNTESKTNQKKLGSTYKEATETEINKILKI